MMYTNKEPRVLKTRPPKLYAFLLLFCFLIFGNNVATGATWYVDGDVASSGDGTSWATAMKTIQEAINVAQEGGEIWVKKGTYALSSTVEVDKIVALYGGFNGAETRRDERDWQNNGTIVDGNDSVRCFHVTNDAILDGFIITWGKSPGGGWENAGGGMNISNSSPTIRNCDFSYNSGMGGGICNYYSSPSITSCTFSYNNAGYWAGGGIANYFSSPTIADCTFSGNSAGYGGGGIFNGVGDPTVENCIFLSNRADYRGGAILIQEGSPNIVECAFSNNRGSSGGAIYVSGSWSLSATINNCTFSSNTADHDGGAIYNDLRGYVALFSKIINCIFIGNAAGSNGGAIYNDSGSPNITNCTFSSNMADICAGGILNDWSSPTITNCILWADLAPNGPEIHNFAYSYPDVTYCDIQGGYPGQGNIDADPQFVDPGNDDFHLLAGSPCIDAGTSEGVPDNDFEGESRYDDPDIPNTGGGLYPYYDIGADEYVPAEQGIDYTITILWWDGASDAEGNYDGKLGDDIGFDRPLRWARVMLFDDDWPFGVNFGEDDFLDEGRLRHNGSYTFENVQSDDADGPDLYVRVELSCTEIVIFARGELPPEYYFTPVEYDVTESLSGTYKMNTAEQSAYAYVFNTIQDLNIQWEENTGYYIPPVEVEVIPEWRSDPGFGKYEQVIPFVDYYMIKLGYNILKPPDSSAWNKYIIAHEYGHHIMFKVYGETWPPGAGSWWSPSGDHILWTESNSGFALTEGWAAFMQNAFFPDWQHDLNYSYGKGKKWLADPWEHSRTDIETNHWWMGEDITRSYKNPNGNSGEIVEGAVASILWDIFDTADTDEPHGGIADGLNKIWDIISTEPHPGNLQEFYEKFISKYPDDEGKLGAIYMAHGIPVALQNLADPVEELDLSQETEDGLVDKLAAASNSLQRGQNKAAKNQLNAFINQVEALRRSKQITDDQADELILAAQNIIDSI